LTLDQFIAMLSSWFGDRPADLLTDAGNPNSQVTQTGDAVALWKDSKGVNDLAQATASKRLTWLSDNGGGHPAVVGDGSNDYLEVTLAGSLSGDFTLEVLFSFASPPATTQVLAELAPGSSDGLHLAMDSSGRVGFPAQGGPVISLWNSTSLADGLLHAAMLTRSGTSYSLYINDTLIGTV
jgi:hypothetical protein